MALTSEELSIVKDVLEKTIPNREVTAFGSRATGKSKPYSDLDLAVMGPRSLSLEESADLREAFSESDLPWRVDVVDFSGCAPWFQEIILRDGLPISDVRRQSLPPEASRPQTTDSV